MIEVRLIDLFTIHFATINTLSTDENGNAINNLQYTLLLLIQEIQIQF